MIEKRRITLEKSYNTRDLGGYETVDNMRTSAYFLRADSLNVLSLSDRCTLLDLGVKTVIDMRNNAEIMRVPSVFERCEEADYCPMPVFSDSEQQDIHRQFGYAFDMGDLYISIVEKNQRALCAILRKMEGASDGKILFYCNAGKDRTGIVSALLLKLAGVDNQTIIYDYCLTEVLLKDTMPFLRANTQVPASVPNEIMDELLGAKAHNMEKLLKHLENKYSGVIEYLQTIGLSQSEIAAIKKKMIDGEV